MAALLAAVATFGLWHELLLFWLVPYATWFQLVLRMRLILEHQHLPGTEPFQTRTILPGPVERLLLSPHRVHLHVEHHLYPGVPFHRLYALHERLRGRPELAGVPLRRGYLRSLLELERPIGSE
jgi:fatty acid desaturase